MDQLTPKMRTREIPREPSKVFGPLYIFGVPGTTDMIKSLMLEAYKADGRPSDIDASNYYNINEISADWSKEYSGYRVSVCKVVHGIMDSRAIRFDVGEKSIVYSGDVGPPSDVSANQNIIRLAQNCDILIFDGLHFTLSDVGIIAAETAAKKLVLTHLDAAWGMEQIHIKLNLVKKNFQGEIAIAPDLMSLEF